MLFDNERIITERDFSKTVNDIFDNEIKVNGGIIAPNVFNLNIINDSKKKGEALGYEFYKKLYLERNYSTIGSDVWNGLARHNNLLSYQIVGYIANSIKYDSNIIRIQLDALRSLTGKEVNAKTFKTAIDILQHLNVIRKTDLRSIYVVNPALIFKGNVDRLIRIIVDNNFSNISLTDSDVCLDKFIAFKEYKSEEGIMIKNGKYHSKYKDLSIEKKEVSKIKFSIKSVKK